MTKDIDDISKRFTFLKEAAQECLKNGGEFPSGIEEQSDISYFNDLLNLYDRIKRGLLNRTAAIAEGTQMRVNYIEQVRADRQKKLIIDRNTQEYNTVTSALTKLLKDFDRLTAAQREELYLEVVSVIDGGVSAKLIKEKLSAAKDEKSGNPSKDKPKKEAEVSSPPEEGKAVIQMILRNGTLHSVYEGDVKHYSELYPSVDIVSELRKMQGWCEANPTRRKTAKGVKKFIASWLSDTQTAKEAIQQSKPENDKESYDINAYVKKSIAPKYKPRDEKESYDIDAYVKRSIGLKYKKQDERNENDD